MLIERYRLWYEHEKAANEKMLDMVESVPPANHSDPKFQRIVDLVVHLAICRENWLDRIAGEGKNQKEWFTTGEKWGGMRQRYANLERAWTLYLGEQSDESIAETFTFPIGEGENYPLLIETQLTQMVGHAFYHRGQVVMLVDELGGDTIDTDYLFWKESK